jgi:hypothetical protein
MEFFCEDRDVIYLLLEGLFFTTVIFKYDIIRSVSLPLSPSGITVDVNSFPKNY